MSARLWNFKSITGKVRNQLGLKFCIETRDCLHAVMFTYHRVASSNTSYLEPHPTYEGILCISTCDFMVVHKLNCNPLHRGFTYLNKKLEKKKHDVKIRKNGKQKNIDLSSTTQQILGEVH